MATLIKLKSNSKNKSLPSLNKSRDDRGKLYNTSHWRKLRICKLMESPLCEWCLKAGRTKPTEHIHHRISPFSVDGDKRIELFYDFDNLEALCVECHSTFHGKHRRNNYKG